MAELSDLLRDISDNVPQKSEPWLDSGPFINAQINAASFSLGRSEKKGSLTLVPVNVSLRRPGHEELAAYAVVGPKDGGMEIENFTYPARPGGQGWELLGWLHKQLKR